MQERTIDKKIRIPPLIVALVGGLFFLVAVVSFALLRRRSDERLARYDVAESDRTGGYSSTRERFPEAAPIRTYPEEWEIREDSIRKGSTGHAAQVVMADFRRLLDVRMRSMQPLEAQVNQLHDYLSGMVQTIRALDPTVFALMRDDFAREICGGIHASDIDLMIFSRLVTLQSEIGSGSALSCALRNRTIEDAVTWSLLDAWNAIGRPAISEVTVLAENSRDDRTRRRLADPLESRAIADEWRMQVRNRARRPDVAEAIRR